MGDSVRMVRQRMLEGLSRGMSMEAATAYANGEPLQRPLADVVAPPQSLLDAARALSPLDHDKNGLPGGSSKPSGPPDELKALREEYLAKLGKRPFPGWDAETLRSKIAAQPA